MGSFLFKLKYVMKHPEFVLQYVVRANSIATLLDVDVAIVKRYLREYKKVNAEIEESLKNYPYLGQMDKRKNQVLYALVRITKPEIAVETGVAAGVSSSIILNAMKMNGRGRLYSIDADLRSFDGVTLPLGKPVGFLIPKDLREHWQLVIGFSKEVLEALLKKLETIDLFFHDSEHSYENMMFEYSTAWKYLKKGGLLVSDNIDWNNAFDDFATRQKVPFKKFYTLGVVKKV